MTTPPSACWPAMGARPWKTCFSTWRAGAGSIARRRNERPRYRRRIFRQSRCRHGAALLVSAALVLAAHSRSDLLAGRADADVGLPAALRVAECRLLRARRRRVHRLGAAVGHSVPRQLGFSISFLEEMYARNLGNIMM